MIEYLNAHPQFIVLIVTALIWTGIASFLWRLDRRIEQLSQQIQERTYEHDNNAHG